jgi:hypothetical protein
MMSGKVVRAFFWLLTGWFFAYDLYLWGGLAVTPTIGKQLTEMALVRSPIAATYLYLGRTAVNAVGQADRAREFAAKRFPEEIADDKSSPLTILNRFLSAQSAAGTMMYYGAPLLLLLSVVLHVRRQKPIRSFGGQP